MQRERHEMHRLLNLLWTTENLLTLTFETLMQIACFGFLNKRHSSLPKQRYWFCHEDKHSIPICKNYIVTIIINVSYNLFWEILCNLIYPEILENIEVWNFQFQICWKLSQRLLDLHSTLPSTHKLSLIS